MVGNADVGAGAGAGVGVAAAAGGVAAGLCLCVSAAPASAATKSSADASKAGAITDDDLKTGLLVRLMGAPAGARFERCCQNMVNLFIPTPRGEARANRGGVLPQDPARP